MGDLCDLTVAEAAKALSDRSIDPVELLRDCLVRIEATEPVLGAWVTIDREGALARANELRKNDPAGPLWGIPIGVKDIIDVAGLPTTAGSKILAGNIAATDAPVVRALREAGAVILGKTNTHEFAYGCVTPPTTNPWDPSRVPGGSSGGSAAAVAVSQCLAALGTDTAGSIRIPSALCGVTGLKPRRGLIPLDGVIPLAPSFDVAGPIARSAEDLSIMWRALGRRNPHLEWTRVAGGKGPDFRLALPDLEYLPELQPELRAEYLAAVQALESIASEVVPFTPPNFYDFDRPRSLVLMVEALEVHRSRGWWPDRAGDYTDETRSYLEYAERQFREGERAALSFDWDVYPNYESALRVCGRFGTEMRGFLDTADVLVTPTLPRDAPTHEEAARTEEGSPRRPVVLELTRIPAPANVADLAAVTVPCGFTSAGLPIGLQLLGEDENLLLDVAAAYQNSTGWSRLRPPIAVSGGGGQ